MGVGGCCYPKSNWPETSCAVPANFHNDRINPLTHTLTHTQRERHTQTLHLSLLLPDNGCSLLFVIIPFFFYMANNHLAICSGEVLFFSVCSPISQSHKWLTQGWKSKASCALVITNGKVFNLVVMSGVALTLLCPSFFLTSCTAIAFSWRAWLHIRAEWDRKHNKKLEEWGEQHIPISLCSLR